MKVATKASYLERIDKVVGYLSSQPVEAMPTLRDLAGVAGISPFHFHRVYRAITGETPAGTVRRLRLARAAAMLKETNKLITDIAFDIGYESSQAFSKAFRDRTGFNASMLRRDPTKLDAVIEDLSSPAKEPTTELLQVRVVSIDPFKVIASRHVGPHDRLFEVYGDLWRWARETRGAEDYRGIYGIPIDDSTGVPAEECRFDCCFDFGPDIEPGRGYREMSLGGGLYAVTRHVGPYEGLERNYDLLCGAWLSASGYAVRDCASYLHYLADPDTLPPEQWETDIYLPIEQAV